MLLSAAAYVRRVVDAVPQYCIDAPTISLRDLLNNSIAVSVSHVLRRFTAATGGGRYFFHWLLETVPAVHS